jgi:hypothetical protein
LNSVGIDDYLRQDLEFEGDITMISSPYIRAIQTAAAIKACLSYPVGTTTDNGEVSVWLRYSISKTRYSSTLTLGLENQRRILNSIRVENFSITQWNVKNYCLSTAIIK